MKNKSRFVPPTRKAPSNKVFEGLRDAFQNGKPMFSAGDNVVMRRDHRREPSISMCTVVHVHEDGDVELYDDTLGQCFIFNVSKPPTLKLDKK